ncbi:MAG: DUF488 family protein [Rhodoplanes sp.]|uniref:DUF488 domain-containing protein n=1 Tax=Rhodoplanes sp. TaxID=1968906 RepID=UPI00181AA227|nr:DUF488 family protein [Rhodoplanes sp.]NVO17579.1 DUF488 family protein [Rhodoplanes sp.]
MALRVVRLGTPRLAQEGTRIGTVRRPPRGVRKEDYAAENWFDVWLPELAPSLPLMAKAHAAATTAEWKAFTRAFRAEMAAPTPKHLLDLLATLSHGANVSIGCYCGDEAHCHRGVLRELLVACGAWIE